MDLTKTKISNFDIIASIKKYVTWSQIPMNYSLSMYVCQAFHYLTKQMPCQFFVKMSVRLKHLSEGSLNTNGNHTHNEKKKQK